MNGSVSRGRITDGRPLRDEGLLADGRPGARCPRGRISGRRGRCPGGPERSEAQA